MNYSRIVTTGVNFAKKDRKDKKPGAVLGNAAPAALPPMQPIPNLPAQRPFYPGPMPQSQTYMVPPLPEEDKGPTVGGALLKAGGAAALGGGVGLVGGALAAPRIADWHINMYKPFYDQATANLRESGKLLDNLAHSAGASPEFHGYQTVLDSWNPEALTHIGAGIGVPLLAGGAGLLLGGIGSLAKSAYDKWGRK
jgi:hypothetical protein